MTVFVDLILLSFILFLGIILIRSKSYMRSVIVIALISILSSITYLVMSAPDVALTEASVGACASSCILLAGLRYLVEKESAFYMNLSKFILYGGICLIFFLMLCYYSVDLLPYGSQSNGGDIAEYYKLNVGKDIGMRSLVTAILASYRGMDTFGETLVIFTAGLCVIFIFGYGILNKRKMEDEDENEVRGR